MISIPEGKLAFFWIAGSVSLLVAAHMLGSSDSIGLSWLVPMLLIMFAGLAWVGVAIGAVHRGKA